MQFALLGAEDASGSPEPGPSTEAAVLPVPPKPPDEVGEQPMGGPPADGAGVDETEVALDRLWQATVEAGVDGEERGLLRGGRRAPHAPRGRGNPAD